jgi:hypothetical protein
MSKRIAGLLMLGAVGLAGCAGGSGGFGASPLAAYPGTEAQIKNMYDDQAVENDWFCTEPEMNNVTRAQAAQDTPTKLVLVVNYEFSSTTANSARSQAECSGFNTRSFTFAKAGGGLTLESMSGEQR